MAYCQAAARRLGDALGAIERCIELDAYHADAQALRAAILWQGTGDVEAAQRSLRRARVLDANNRLARQVAEAIASGNSGRLPW